MDPTKASVPSASVTRRLDQELTMVEGAIAMVSRRGTPSVTVGGLRFGEEVLEALTAQAGHAGVLLEPLWRLDCHGCDIRVHPAA